MEDGVGQTSQKVDPTGATKPGKEDTAQQKYPYRGNGLAAYILCVDKSGYPALRASAAHCDRVIGGSALGRLSFS